MVEPLYDGVHPAGEEEELRMLLQAPVDSLQPYHCLAQVAEEHLVEEAEAELAREIDQDIVEIAASDPLEHFQN